MDLENPLVVDFPLRGEWVAPNTPGDKVPSHGTDALGQRFAFDFLRTDPKDSKKFFDDSQIKYYLIGIPVEKCYCYKEKVYSSVDGKVIAAMDGIREPKRLHLFFDILKVLGRSLSFFFQSLIIPLHKINLHKYIGNYVIVEFDGNYAFFAHLHTGSITVREGQTIKKGDLIGLVGHTGNSTAPHLHFHVMDSDELLSAKGLPCSFSKCELLVDNEWKTVENYIPRSEDRIRVL